MYLPSEDKSCNIPAILEFGNLTMRAGFAGQDSPDILEDSILGHLEDEGTDRFKRLFELSTFSKPSHQNYSLVNPMKNKIQFNQEYIEEYVDFILSKKLKTPFEKTPLFFVEPAIHNKEQRLQMVQTMFENYGTPSIYFHKAPLLTLYVFAKENATIVDMGAETTFCTPIVEGFISSKGVIKCDFGGEDLTQDLMNILESRGNKLTPYSEYKYKVDLNAIENSDAEYFDYCKNDFSREVKHTMCQLLPDGLEKLKFKEGIDNTTYELPDKSLLVMSKEIYSVPERLFQAPPNHEFQGLTNLISQSLEKIDHETRKELMSNIILTGGASLVPGLLDRLQNELQKQDILGLGFKAKVTSSLINMERRYSNWLGASILASMSTFSNLCMSKQEYQEHGAVLIERKCLS